MGPSLQSRNTRSTSFCFDWRIKGEGTPCKEHYQFSNTGPLKNHCHCSLYIWNHEIITKKSTSCSSNNIVPTNTAKLDSNHQDKKEWLHNVNGAKAMATRKPTAQSPTTVSNAEGHITLKVVKTWRHSIHMILMQRETPCKLQRLHGLPWPCIKKKQKQFPIRTQKQCQNHLNKTTEISQQ
jgi:hypothetical protein